MIKKIINDNNKYLKILNILDELEELEILNTKLNTRENMKNKISIRKINIDNLSYEEYLNYINFLNLEQDFSTEINKKNIFYNIENLPIVLLEDKTSKEKEIKENEISRYKYQSNYSF